VTRHAPAAAEEIAALVRDAGAASRTLEVVGTGTRRALGRPVDADAVLDVSALAGVVAYEPEELAIVARPATALAEVRALLAQRGQHLAFEPPDLGPLLGRAAGEGTLGGAVAMNLSGPRRLSAGALRDHFLGFSGVSGRGEAFKAGGRVVKNVTGYDLMKVVAGSWGTLVVLTEVVLKTLPAPETVRTVVVRGLADADAVRAMADAMGSPHEVSGAAHLPADVAPALGLDGASTLLRLEGVPPSVLPRLAQLSKRMEAFGGEVGDLDDGPSRGLWEGVRDVRPFADRPDEVVWKVSVAPSEGARAADAIRRATGARVFLDWAGGLVWAAVPPGPPDGGAAAVRGAVGAAGHATLVRAPEELRRTVPVFHPQAAPLAALSARVKVSFDPKGVLNPGRMG
jgi:glycolate oxidase FAD binding subunit